MKLIRHGCGIVLVTLPLLSLAGENPSALNALKLLPKEELQSLARIEAFDGNPVPERWHVLVHDPNTPSGVREYVIADGELVAARGISQFAESLKADEVIPHNTLRIDTDKLARLAKDYAATNNLAVGSYSYHLLKKGREAEPVWEVRCHDEAGKTVGTVIVTAASGIIVSHPGFNSGPKVTANHTGPMTVADWERDSGQPSGEKRARSQNTEAASESTASGNSRKKTTATAAKRSTERKRTASASARNSSRAGARGQAAEMQPPPVFVERKPNPVGNFFRKVFRGRGER